MKVRIESDGTVKGTRVLDAASGEALPAVRSVRFEHTACDIPHAVIELISFQGQVTVVLEAEAEIRAIAPSSCDVTPHGTAYREFQPLSFRGAMAEIGRVMRHWRDSRRRFRPTAPANLVIPKPVAVPSVRAK